MIVPEPWNKYYEKALKEVQESLENGEVSYEELMDDWVRYDLNGMILHDPAIIVKALSKYEVKAEDVRVMEEKKELPKTIEVAGMEAEPTAIVTIALEDGNLITGMAAEVASFLKIRNYNGAPEGSPEWKAEMTRLCQEHKQLEDLLHSRKQDE